MVTDKLKKKSFQEQLKDELPELIKELFESEQICEFIEYLLNNGWKTYNETIIEDIKEYEVFWESFYKDEVEIGLVQSVEKLEVGIDPVSCYDKMRRCSIRATLPMSKRDYKRFIQKLESVTQGKERQQWFKKASSCWYGSYAIYGEGEF